MIDGVNKAALCDWMTEQGLLASGGHADLTQLTGGTQNILVKIDTPDDSFVLRRPPLSLRKNSNETMRREARMLSALSRTSIPHPAFRAVCEDVSVLGSAFYIMNAIDGFNPVEGLPEPHAHSREIRHEMGLSLVRGLSQMGALDPQSLGVFDLGKPDNYLERQVSRWKAQLSSYDDVEQWDGRSELPGIDRIGKWLDEHRPAQTAPGILHGDAHLGNTLYSFDGSKLAALIDWELTTIGDPLVDLGWLLATWPENAEDFGTGAVGITPWDGFPSPQELVSAYGELSPRDVRAAEWYGVLGCYKLGIIQEGTYARACAGQVPRDIGENLHERTIWLLERALQWIS